MPSDNLWVVPSNALFKFFIFPRFWGRKDPSDRFPAQIFIILPSLRPVAVKIAVLRAVTRLFARNFSFSVAVAPPRSHFHRVLNLNVTGQRTRHLVAGTLDPIVGAVHFGVEMRRYIISESFVIGA